MIKPRLNESNLDLDFLMQSPMPTVIDECMARFTKQCAEKKDAVIMQAFEGAGVYIVNQDEIKQHVTRIIQDGDPFEHYFYKYGTPEQKRIISIDRDPQFQQMSNVLNPDYNFKFEASWRYY